MGRGFSTRCLYGSKGRFDKDETGAISFPIYQTATFAHPALGESSGYDYSRLQNPTRQHVEEIVASLEGGEDALAYSSGMAAVAALMELFSPGEHIIAGGDLYGGCIRLFDNISRKNGIEVEQLDCAGDSIEGHIKGNTRAIYIETPTNPMMNVVDIKRLSDIAKGNGLLLIVDNTFLTPYFQRPLKLGADIVVHSGTKFLGGHNDTMAGFLVAGDKDIADRLRFLTKTVGSGLSPFDSWLIARGIKTLPLRMEQSQSNAKRVVEFLQQEKVVKKVYYPGIPGREAYEISRRQSSGFGSMLSFSVGSAELAAHILSATKLIPFAESLGGTETLLTYPVTQTHADTPLEIRERNGITDCLLRLSVGIEAAEDIIEDLRQAIESFPGDIKA